MGVVVIDIENYDYPPTRKIGFFSSFSMGMVLAWLAGWHSLNGVLGWNEIKRGGVDTWMVLCI